MLAFGAMWTEETVAGRPAWRHAPSGVVFRKVPGGVFRMGLSDEELDAVHAIERSGGVEDTIAPFLIARHPLTVAQVRHWLPEYEDAYAETDTGRARLDDDLDDFSDETRTAATENAFGLAAMGSANELCADVWIPGYARAPADTRPRSGDGPRTVRGGAADLYPWQGCDEWLLLLCAARDEHADFTAVRPVAPSPDDLRRAPGVD